MNSEHKAESNKSLFDTLLKRFSSNRFLSCEGIGNELPIYICPFDPNNAVAMADTIRLLEKQLAKQSIPVLEINLYDLAVKILQEEDLWERLGEFEQKAGKDELLETLQGVLDPEEHLIPAIEEMAELHEHRILFITGVGEVYPYIRTHAILNNFQRIVKNKPVVLFFPGKYTHNLEQGAALNLFGLFQNDKYYRAYNIFNLA